MSETTITTVTTPAVDVESGARFVRDGKSYALAGWGTNDEGKFFAVESAEDGREVWPLTEGMTLDVIVPDTADTADVEGPAGDGAGNGASASVDLSQCAFVTEAGRRCKLAPDHVNSPDAKTRKHKMVIRDEVKQPKTLAELRAESPKVKFTLVREDIPADAVVVREYNRPAIERDEDQKRVDADALVAYQKWTKGGKKTGTFEELAPKFGSRYIVPAVAFDTVIMMLRRATQAGTKTTGKKLAYRRAAHTSGNVIVNYMITDEGAVKQPKKDNGESA